MFGVPSSDQDGSCRAKRATGMSAASPRYRHPPRTSQICGRCAQFVRISGLRHEPDGMPASCRSQVTAHGRDRGSQSSPQAELGRQWVSDQKTDLNSARFKRWTDHVKRVGHVVAAAYGTREKISCKGAPSAARHSRWSHQARPLWQPAARRVRNGFLSGSTLDSSATRGMSIVPAWHARAGLDP